MPHTQIDFESFFNESEYCIGVFNDSWTVINSSTSWLKRIGIDQFEKHKLEDFISERDLLHLTDQCEALNVGEKVTIALLCLVSKSKKHYYFQGEVKKASKTHFHFLFVDASQSQQKLSAFHQISEKAKIAGFRFDPSTGKGYWDKQLFNLYGIDPNSKITSQLLLDHIANEYQPAFNKAVESLYEDRCLFRIIVGMVGDDQILRYIDMYAQPHVVKEEIVLVSGFSQDVTDEVKKRMLLEKRNELVVVSSPLSQAFSNSGDRPFGGGEDGFLDMAFGKTPCA